MSAKQKSSRGNGSKGNSGRERPERLHDYTAEIKDILKDILRGNLSLLEIPRFVLWLLRGGMA